MRAMVIVNPRAGRGRGARIWSRLASRVRELHDCESAVPGTEAETVRLAAEAARRGLERVVVVGGDGTINAVAGALAGTRTALGVIPAGTGNDFCRNCYLPGQFDRAVETALWAVPRPIDLGQIEGDRHFVNVAGVGFDARVARIAGGYPKGLGGTLPYLLGALSTLPRYEAHQVEVRVDGERPERYAGPSMLVAVANGRWYAGGMQIAPGALTDDGLLDVTIAAGVTRLELLRLLGLVYSGRHVHHPKVRVMRGREIRLRLGGPADVHLDGEPVAPRELNFRVRPRALAVAMPAPASSDMEFAAELTGRTGTPQSEVWWD